jgi:hypothetical protein
MNMAIALKGAVPARTDLYDWTVAAGYREFNRDGRDDSDGRL